MFHMTLLDNALRPTIVPEWTMADRLRKARELTGLDQTEFAERVEISRQAIGNYESGRREPKGLYLRAWVEATGVDMHWLETGHEKTPANELTGVCDLCALTGSNRGPADYGLWLDSALPPEASGRFGSEYLNAISLSEFHTAADFLALCGGEAVAS